MIDWLSKKTLWEHPYLLAVSAQSSEVVSLWVGHSPGDPTKYKDPTASEGKPLISQLVEGENLPAIEKLERLEPGCLCKQDINGQVVGDVIMDKNTRASLASSKTPPTIADTAAAPATEGPGSGSAGAKEGQHGCNPCQEHKLLCGCCTDIPEHRIFHSAFLPTESSLVKSDE